MPDFLESKKKLSIEKMRFWIRNGYLYSIGYEKKSLVEITQCSLYATVTKFSSTDPAAVSAGFLRTVNLPLVIKRSVNPNSTFGFHFFQEFSSQPE